MDPVKLSRADWPFLRRESLIAAGALALAAIMAALAWNDYRTAHLQRDQARTALQDVQNQLAAAEEAKAELIQMLPEYNALQARGWLGEEQRDAWRSLLRRARERSGLNTARYELSPSKPYPASDHTAGGPQRYRSTMNLETSFQHELDFLTFMEEISRDASALIIPAQCALSRTPDGGDSRNAPPLLVSQCTIDWITLKRPNPGSAEEATQ